jgi:hypothetical protein
MKILKLTDSKAQNQSRYLKKKKNKIKIILKNPKFRKKRNFRNLPIHRENRSRYLKKKRK